MENPNKRKFEWILLKSRQVGKSHMNSMNMMKQILEYRKFSRCQSIKKIFNI
jgi:hypothetical protein